ncbi:MAG: hypothetical protein ACO1SV_10190 [Fimbriimonas sp.]
MSEIVSFDELQRPRKAETPFRIWLLSPTLQYQCLAWGIAAAIAEVWLTFELASEGFTFAAWARFLVPQVLIVPVAVRAGLRAIRARATTLEIDASTLRVKWQGEVREEIALSDIKGYEIFPEGSVWLRIETNDGRVCEIERRDMVWGPQMEEAVLRHLGPRLAAKSLQKRGVRPESPVEARAWDFFGDPPAVAMLPGKRYRYLDPGYLRKQGIQSVSSLGGMIVPIAPLIQVLVHPGSSLGATLFAIGMLGLALPLFLLQAWKGARLWMAGDDRFERVPEGLRVTRGTRSWVVTAPCPATEFPFWASSFGRPLLRFGTYYFDPRFIEEDER